MARNQVNPPPLRTISDFKSKLTGGGARANLFEVVLTFPDAATPTQEFLTNQDSWLKGQDYLLQTLHKSKYLSEEGFLKSQVTEHLIHGQLQLSTIQTSQSGLHLKTG